MPAVVEQASLSSEDRLWAGLSLPVLSKEELANRQAAVEDKVHFYRGVWWRQARPFFWMPCSPLAQVNHDVTWPHPLRAVFGFTHLSTLGSPTNCSYSAIVREDPGDYSIGQLSRSRRYAVRKALSHLRVGVVESMDELLADGYEVYVSCHQRIGWGTDKSNPRAFAMWMGRAFQQPKQIVLGAYRQQKLIAFMLPCAVEKVATPSYVASHSDHLACLPNDALFHAFLCIARQTPGIETVSWGPVSSKPSLDSFKLHYGTIKRYAAYTWLNPALRALDKTWIRKRYPWLAGSATPTN